MGPVVEIRSDQTGCNWKIFVIQGAYSSRRLLAMSDFICGLRAEYLLEIGDEIAPTLLATWAYGKAIAAHDVDALAAHEQAGDLRGRDESPAGPRRASRGCR